MSQTDTVKIHIESLRYLTAAMIERDECRELKIQAEERLNSTQSALGASMEKNASCEAQIKEIEAINERLRLSDQECQQSVDIWIDEAKKQERQGWVKTAGGIVVGVLIGLLL